MPIEDPRNLREVGIFLRSLERTFDTKISEICKDLDEIKSELAKRNTRKSDVISAILTSVVSSCVIGLIFWVVNNNVGIN